MSRANNKRPFNCVRSRKRPEHHWSRGSGMEKMQGRWAESFDSVIVKEDLREPFLPNCF